MIDYVELLCMSKKEQERFIEKMTNEEYEELVELIRKIYSNPIQKPTMFGVN